MYLLDSDVFIDAKNRHYGFDIVPAFWDWLVQTHGAGRVFTVERCALEVIAGGDDLADWMKARSPTFAIKPTADDQAALQMVSQWANSAGFRQGAVAQFLAAGDYFLVAQALSLGYTVVTQEEPAPLSQKKIKIPDACQAVGVQWTSPFQMLRAEGARFTL
jgi:hypothetical protein